ncbi:hypothetical protein CAOG_009977 [Capsaspora owczarzaki ATCC 30864]|uniref:Uncharacterized protein n=1 Tax=Capsaspora owczarzaki (strain ATCC 30864) TaxID=595528 RepID=A0A0D2VWH9_CAPO3|nr:hypothetical protein CAOG_009977 [Capsaspora owczarzaki ATCC 30864]
MKITTTRIERCAAVAASTACDDVKVTAWRTLKGGGKRDCAGIPSKRDDDRSSSSVTRGFKNASARGWRYCSSDHHSSHHSLGERVSVLHAAAAAGFDSFARKKKPKNGENKRVKMH